MQCLKDGWEIIKNQYWLFVGMTLVAVLIGGAVPLGILLGPMMCGLHMTFFRARRGEMVEFSMLFKGFDYFGQSLIATLLYMVPIVVVVVPAYLLFYVGMFVSMAAQGDEPNPAAAFGVMGMFMLVWVVVLLLILIISIGFTFTYPLIADRKLSGFDAVKLSFRAALANFWRLLGLMLLTALLNIAGVIACYVGMFLVIPIGYAAIAKAYEQVFGLSDGTDYSNLPPPPPIFSPER
ncbi:MAG TPA: hypothetical protein VLB46_07465 [Pyrinomonadaceae bacterium]|nr:hypothetical protein [Pyrinomonadaceae bacterium]